MIFDADILPSIVFGVFVSVALIAGLQMIRAEIRSGGGAENRVADLCFWLMVAAIVGARVGDLFYIPEVIFTDPLEILRFWNGGSFYYGGAAAGLIVGWIFIKYARLPLWKTADMFAPTLAIGHFFVWLGCFFSGLCPSRRTDSMLEGLLFSPGEGPYGILAIPHPRPFYLASGSFLIFILLLMLRGHRSFDGRVFWVYIMLHSTLQLLVDTLNFPGYIKASSTNLSNSQVIYALTAIIGLSMLFYLWYRSRQPIPEGS